MTFYVQQDGVWTEVYDYQADIGSSWRRVQKAYVQAGGVWKEFHNFVEAILTSTTASTSVTTINNAPSGSAVISGAVSLASGAGYAPAGTTVELWHGGSKLLTTTTGANGTYSFTWTPTTLGAFNLVVRFVGAAPLQPSQAPVPTITVNASTSFTSVSIPAQPTIGTASAYTGTVTAPTASKPSGGTVTLKFGSTTKASASVAANGTFSVSYTPTSSDRGSQAVSLTYSGDGNFLASSHSGSTTVYQPTPAKPAQSVYSISNSSATLRVKEQANTTKYVSTCIENGNTQTINSTGTVGANLDFKWSYGQDTTYNFKITAFSDNPVDNQTDGNTITITSGHAAVTDSGTATFEVPAAETGSWRSVDGWTYLGTSTLAQGYYTSSFGAYYGVARISHTVLRGLVDNYGTARSGRWQNVTCTKLQTYLSRKTGSGSSAAVPIGWYMSDVDPNNVNEQPYLNWGPTTSSPAGLVPGASGWLTLPDPNWGKLLLGGQWISLAMHVNNSTNYAQYEGSTDFKVRVTYTWNWTPIAYKAPTHSSSG